MTALLELADVSIHFGGIKAVTGVSFAARAGEVRALIGPNGAGKTTLFNAITGYAPLESGVIRFQGKEIQGLSPHAIAALGVRRTFQNGGLFADMTVLENVLTGLHTQVNSGVFGLLVGGRRAQETEVAAVARARELLAVMEIDQLADRPVKELAGGQQRLVEITRALATGAPLLLLDEPAVGLSPPVRDRLMQVIRRLASEHGIGILLIEHSIDMVMNGADVIVVLNFGERIAEGPAHEIRQDRQVLDAYLGYA